LASSLSSRGGSAAWEKPFKSRSIEQLPIAKLVKRANPTAITMI